MAKNVVCRWWWKTKLLKDTGVICWKDLSKRTTTMLTSLIEILTFISDWTSKFREAKEIAVFTFIYRGIRSFKVTNKRIRQTRKSFIKELGGKIDLGRILTVQVWREKLWWVLY